MSKNLKKGKIALVTGGSRGIGRAISVMLAEHFADTVFVNYLENSETAEETKLIVEQAGAICELMQANISRPNDITDMFQEIANKVEKIDYFIHCAAINAFKPLKDIKPNQWDLIVNTNARSFLLCAQSVITMMDEGVIVAITSLGGRRYVKNYGAMGPTKAALEATIRTLAVELAPQSIRVNGVCASFVETDSLKWFPEYKEMLNEVKRLTPVGRIGKPMDIANLVKFLCSEESNWICGQQVVIDGGLSIL